jgi:uroporphyrinogen decarboxylase
MNSRQRVEKTITFQEPDRVPIDLGGMKASGIAVAAYDRLKKHLAMSGRSKIFDARFMIALVEEMVRQRFHVDVVPLDASTILSQTQPEDQWVPRTLFNGDEALFLPGTRIHEEPNGDWWLVQDDGSLSSFRMPKNGFYFDDTSFGIAQGEFDPRKFRPIATIPDENLRKLESYGRHLYENTEYALLGWGYGVCFLGLSLITDRLNNVTQGMPKEWMMMLMTEKETCHEIMGRSVEAYIQCMKLIQQAVGDYCFAWGIASDDAGTQRGEFIRPALWAEMLKPHYRTLCDWMHANTRMKTFFHCCGSIYNLIPHLIEAGIDILNPIQTSAANMEPRRLKDQFGDRLVFWGGGCDTQQILPKATPEAVRQHVKERLGILAPGGGYVFNQIHNIQADVPPENIEAMLDAAYEYGAYPVKGPETV